MKPGLRVLMRSLTVSLIVFVVELGGVAGLDALGVTDAVSFAAVQILGTCLTFVLNKYWTFEARNTGRTSREAKRSAIVFAGSFVLNIGLPSFATYVLHLAPTIAFTASQIIVGLAWNFPMNRWWVFKKDREPVGVMHEA